MLKDKPDLTPLLNTVTVFKPPTPYLDELTRIAQRWNEIDKKEAHNAKHQNECGQAGKNLGGNLFSRTIDQDEINAEKSARLKCTKLEGGKKN